MTTSRCADACAEPLLQLKSSLCCSSPCKIATTALSTLALLAGILVLSKAIHLQSVGTTVPGWACIGSGLTLIAAATCVHYIRKQTTVDSMSPAAATPATTPNPDEEPSAVESSENNALNASEQSATSTLDQKHDDNTQADQALPLVVAPLSKSNLKAQTPSLEPEPTLALSHPNTVLQHPESKPLDTAYKSTIEATEALLAQHLNIPEANDATQKEHALEIRKSLHAIKDTKIRDEKLIYFAEQYFAQGRILAACTCVRRLRDNEKRNAQCVAFAQRLFDEHQKRLDEQKVQPDYPLQILTCLRSINDATMKNAQLSSFTNQYTVSANNLRAACIFSWAMHSDSEELPQWLKKVF